MSQNCQILQKTMKSLMTTQLTLLMLVLEIEIPKIDTKRRILKKKQKK